MPEPLEVLWTLAPAEIKLELSLNVIVEILKISDGGLFFTFKTNKCTY